VNPRLRHALEYPELYLGALRARRHLSTLGPLEPAEALRVAQSYHWRGGNVEPTQAPVEILWLLEQVRELQPRRILEIGTDEGGTLFLWTRVAPADAHLVALDIRPLGLLGGLSSWALVRRGLGHGSQRIDLAMPRDSHDAATVEHVRSLFGGEPVDFLFIDGDHSYDGVRQDFEMYSPLVRAGGLVAFHDTSAPDAPDVVRYWQELRASHEADERVSPDTPHYGIGVIRL
jgi:cephalosporin hydroxylase